MVDISESRWIKPDCFQDTDAVNPSSAALKSDKHNKSLLNGFFLI
jgi:hypothetical protein